MKAKVILKKIFFEEVSSNVIFGVISTIFIALDIWILWFSKIRISFTDWPIYLTIGLTALILAAFGAFLRSQFDCRNGNVVNKILLAAGILSLLTFFIGVTGSGPLFQSCNLHSEVAAHVQEAKGEAFPNLLGKNNDTSNLPLIGDAEAIKRAETEMGKFPALGSQFRLDKDELTSQNMDGKLVYVIPLEPTDMFKWDSKEGAPGFFIVDRNNGKTEFVEKAFFTTTAAPFGDNILRVVNSYLDKEGISGLTTDPSPEVDDEKDLHFITTVYNHKGFCGGYNEVLGVVDVNAHTKETKFYSMKDIPDWVDRVIPENFFVTYLGDYGTYKNGFWNSAFAKKDVQSMTTDSSLPETDEVTGKTHENPKAYDVVYIDGVCYYYTGWTSVGKEGASNGIMMMDSRTGDITYYPTYGISEGKAQSVVEGLVSDKGYESTYPLLLKVAGEETYFHLMRDKTENLVGYAFCSYKDYTKAAYGTSIDEAEAAYIKSLGKSAESVSTELDKAKAETAKGIIEDIRSEVLDGNTIYYIKVNSVNDKIFSAHSKVNIDLVFAEKGDEIEIEYYASDSSVEAIKSCKIS